MGQDCRRQLLTCPHHDWVLNRPTPALTVIFSWTPGSLVQQELSWITFCLLLWDTPEQRGASGSTVLTCQNSGNILISVLAGPHQLGWASLISGLTARISCSDSSHSGLHCHPSPSFRITGSTASWGGFFGSQGCSVIATAAIEIHSWMSVPWAESSESSHGEEAGFASFRLGLFRQIPKASFLCGLFQNLLKVPGDLLLDKNFSPMLGVRPENCWTDVRSEAFSIQPLDRQPANLPGCKWDVFELLPLREKDKIPKKLESSPPQEKQHERPGWLESAAFMPVKTIKVLFFFPFSGNHNGLYLIESSNSYMDFSSLASCHLTDKKYTPVPKNANSLKRVYGPMYDELLLRCGVNIIIPARNIDGSVLEGEASVSTRGWNLRWKSTLECVGSFLGDLLLYPPQSYQKGLANDQTPHTNGISQEVLLGRIFMPAAPSILDLKSLLVEKSPC